LLETKQNLERFRRRPDNTGTARAKYLHLLEDPEVKRWHQIVTRGSRITADVYLRRLEALCNARRISLHELLKTSEQELTDLLMDIVSEMEEQGYAGLTPGQRLH
jgi:predicted nucleic acid-binding OB-fold protein